MRRRSRRRERNMQLKLERGWPKRAKRGKPSRRSSGRRDTGRLKVNRNTKSSDVFGSLLINISDVNKLRTIHHYQFDYCNISLH